MPTPFDSWDEKKISEVLGNSIPEFVSRYQPYIEGDHWQDGEGWIGPRPDQNDATFDEVMALIRDGFVSSNIILEVVERHAAGVMGHEPSWGFTLVEPLPEGQKPDDAQQALIDEAEAFVTDWWDERGAHDVLRKAVANALWGQTGLVRVYLPKGRLDLIGGATGSLVGSVNVDKSNFAAVMKNIYVEAPSPLDAVVYTDPETMFEVAIVRYRVEDEAGTEVTVYELTYVDYSVAEPETVYRTVIGSAVNEVRVPLGGVSPVVGLSRTPIISDQVIQNQKAVNLALTLVPKNLADAAFLERTFLNARMPGEMREVEVNGVTRKVWTPGEYATGPGAVNFVSGIEIEKPDGTVALTDPQLVHRGPTDVNPVIAARGFHYNVILEEVKQSHVLMNEDGRASGKSREMARLDYNISLQTTKSVADKVGRNFLQGVLALAEMIAGTPGKYTERLRSYFECRIDQGPVAITERQQNTIDVNANLMSVETAMARAGILDVEKEKVLIAGSNDAVMNKFKKFAEIVSAMNGAVRPSIVATIMGMDADVVSALKADEDESAKVTAQNANNKPAVINDGNPQGGA